MSAEPDRRQRILGAVLGSAWGDVLGCPVETWTEAEIRTVYGRYVFPHRFPLKDFRHLSAARLKRVRGKLRPPGLHSDDTAQALALLACVLDPRGWQLETWCRTITSGFRMGAWRGVGQNFREAGNRLSGGESTYRCGNPTDSLGGVMRAGLLGTIAGDDPELLNRVVLESTLVTHRHLSVAAMAYAVARAVGLFVTGGTIEEVRGQLPGDVAAFERHSRAHAEVWGLDHTSSGNVATALAEVIAAGNGEAARIPELVCDVAKAFLPPASPTHPNYGSVFLGGIHALAVSLQERPRPQSCLLRIVRKGADTDTVACIAGGILGARLGPAWVPRRHLLDRNRLQDWAESLSAARRLESPGSLLRHEARWTDYERGYRAAMKEALRTLL